MSVSIKRTNTASAWLIGGVITNKTIFTSKYKTVGFEYSVTDSHYTEGDGTTGFRVGISEKTIIEDAGEKLNNEAILTVGHGLKDKMTSMIDISNINKNGLFYVIGASLGPYASITVNVYKIWLE